MPTPLDTLLKRLALRERAARALHGAVAGTAIGCVATIAGCAIVGTSALWMTPVGATLGVLSQILRPIHRIALASRVDARHDLRELVATASHLRPSTTDPIERLVLSQAEEQAATIDVGPIALPPPKAGAWAGIGLGLVATIAVVHCVSSMPSPAKLRDSVRRSSPLADNGGQSPARLDASGSNDRASTPTQEENTATLTASDSASHPFAAETADASPAMATSDSAGSGVATSDDHATSVARNRIRTSHEAPPQAGTTIADAGGHSSASGDATNIDVNRAAPRGADPLLVDPRTSSDWSTAVAMARAALNDGRVPDSSRDVVREYFSLTPAPP